MTVTITRAVTIGPDNMPQVVPAGSEVKLLTKNPTAEWVTIQRGRYTGAVRRSLLVVR